MQQAYIVLHNFVYRPGGRLYQTGDMLKGVFAENDPWIKGMIKYGYLRKATKEDYVTVDYLGHNIARQNRNRLNRMHKANVAVNKEFDEKHNKKAKKRSGKNAIHNRVGNTNSTNASSRRSSNRHFDGGLWTISTIDLSAGQGTGED